MKLFLYFFVLYKIVLIKKKSVLTMSSGGYPGTWERGSLTSDIDVRYENFASKVPS